MALTNPDETENPAKSRALSILGPGLISGASDDDPSGIATYSQVGAPNSASAFPGRCCSLIHCWRPSKVMGEFTLCGVAGGRRHDRCGSRYDRHCGPIAQVLSRNSYLVGTRRR